MVGVSIRFDEMRGTDTVGVSLAWEVEKYDIPTATGQIRAGELED